MVDYSIEGFIMPIEKGDVRGYASINRMMYRVRGEDEDGLDVLGSYFIYLLHPELGSMHFTLERSGNDENPWEIDGATSLEDEILKEIIDEIEIRRIKVDIGI